MEDPSPRPHTHSEADVDAANAVNSAQSQQPPLDGRHVRSHPVLAWIVIIALVSFMVWVANRPEPAGPNAVETVNLQTELTAKLVIAVEPKLSPSMRPWLVGQIATLKTSRSISDRLAYTVIIADLEGPTRGLTELAEIETDLQNSSPKSEQQADQPLQLTPDDQQLINILRSIYQAHEENRSADLTAGEQKLLTARLQWVGRLAPLTRGTSDVLARQQLLQPLERFPWVIAAVGVWYVGCGLAGGVLLIVLLVNAILRQLQHGFRAFSGRGGIYAETFAFWLLVFWELRESVHLVSSSAGLALNIVLPLLAIFAVAWPVMRGVPWAVVRQDIGLYLPRHPLNELAFGLTTYCMALPLLLVGAVMTIALTALQQKFSPGAPPPSHPVQEYLVGAKWGAIAQVLFLGVIVAPFCEEIMFRGVLYRHLRDATGRLGFILSVVISAGISSFIFSAIHPQGWVTIPALMGLAVAFCLAREWRGSLMAGMIAHGTTNFVTLMLNVLLFS